MIRFCHAGGGRDLTGSARMIDGGCGMALTRDERTVLEAAGVATVRDRLRHAGTGRGAAVPGFSSGDLARGDVEDWLANKEHQESRALRCRANLGIAISLVSMVVGLAGLVLALLK
jgi:hypothetical protein